MNRVHSRHDKKRYNSPSAFIFAFMIRHSNVSPQLQIEVYELKEDETVVELLAHECLMNS